MVPSVATEKIPGVTPPGIDPETVRLVALPQAPLYVIVYVKSVKLCDLQIVLNCIVVSLCLKVR
jgi:hypothetical protein